MEQSPYVDVTLDLTRRLRDEFPRVGVCLQAYLYPHARGSRGHDGRAASASAW